MSNYVLFQFFRKLYQQGIPLGASDYLLALEAMRSGAGLEDLEQLKRLLRLLWTKSLEEQELFDREFKKSVEPHLRPSLAALQPREGFEKIEQFKLLCNLRWTQSPKEQDLFNQAFAELVELQLELPAASSQSSTPEPSKLSETASSSSSEPHESPKTILAPSTEVVPKLEKRKQRTIVQKRVEVHFDLVRALSPPAKLDKLETSHHYQLTPRLPMTVREMATIWRQLRCPQRLGRLEELDVAETINSICRTGLLWRPVLRPCCRNQARLVVLIDQKGSMAPFSLLVEAICEGMIRGGLLGRVRFYYFHDCPEKYLYQRPQLTGAIPLETVLSEQAQGSSVLIISDAGSAYGFHEKQRKQDTRTFLTLLSNYTYLYAWLNPMPQYRWTATTAEDIARIVPMFPLDREGLNDTVNILRGYPFPPGVDLNE